ncbi:myosin-4-like [Schistocerca americana]|uniref:myosin-4-like n=1 Tax=Schistocerca americana TaxID=7009 RepID=UPI001F4FD57F|nr:myosin-4-like [Schistocerca americana]
MSTEDKQVCEAVVERKGIGQEDRDDSGISDYGLYLESPLAHSTSYPETLGQTTRDKSVSEGADMRSMLADLLKEIKATKVREEIFRKSLKEDLQETRKSLKEDLQETREREEIFRKSVEEGLREAREREEIFRKSLKEDLQETRESLKEDLQETRESFEKDLQETIEREEIFRKSLKEDLQESLEKSFKETIAQEIKTSQMKIEYNLKKEMQELQERLKMDISERESKLQKSIDQVQGDVEKMEGKLTKKIEDNIEETKAELGERITEVETNCNHRIAEVTQMQKQCNDAVKGIGDRQNQLAVNLRNAIAVQREEDNKRVAMEVRQLQQGVQQLESKTEEIDKRISNATSTVGEGRVVTLMSSDNRYIQNNTGQKFKPKGGLHPMIFMKWLKGVFPAHFKDADKIQFAIDRMEGEAFTWGVGKKEGTTGIDQFEGEFLKKYWSKSHQCAAIEDLLHRKSLNTWRGKLREFAEHLWELNETLEQPLSDDIMISAIKRRLSQRMQETVSGSLIKDREALMEILEQLESVRSQEHNQANDQNREGRSDQRNPFNNSSNYRGRGGGNGYRNHGGGRQWRNDWRRSEEPRDHERGRDRRMNDTVHIEVAERPEN